MESSLVRAHVVIRGRVQMVGFREFARRHLQAAGLRGTVRNAPDGSVECVTEGPPDDVRGLIERLRVGPSHARVESVDVDYQPAVGDLPSFPVIA